MLQRFKPSFAVRSTSKRPDFPNNMTEEEQEIMRRHSEFWNKLLLEGSALVTGPVQDPKGTYGLAVIFAGSEEEAREMLKDDPAQQLSVYSYFPMLACYDEK